MAKVTIYFTINGNTPAETLLKDPILSMNGVATDPGTGDLLYSTSVSAQGTSDEVQVGMVTAYLPKGEYLITPRVTVSSTDRGHRFRICRCRSQAASTSRAR